MLPELTETGNNSITNNRNKEERFFFKISENMHKGKIIIVMNTEFINGYNK